MKTKDTLYHDFVIQGEKFKQRQMLEKAILAFDKAINLDSINSWAYRSKYYAYLFFHKPRQAQKTLRDAIRNIQKHTNRDNAATANLSIMSLTYILKDWETQLKLLDPMTQGEMIEEKYYLYSQKANALASLGKMKEAEQIYTDYFKIVAYKPEFITDYYEFIRYRIKDEKKYKKIAKNYISYLDKKLLKAKSKEEKYEILSNKYDFISRVTYEGDVLKLLTELLKVHPKVGIEYYITEKIRLLSEKNKNKEALKALESFYRKSYLSKFRYLSEKLKLHKALNLEMEELKKQTITEVKTNKEEIYSLYDIEQLGDPAFTLQVVNTLMESDNDIYNSNYVIKSRALEALKRYDEAEKILLKRLKKDPYNTSEYYLLTEFYKSTGDFEKAIKFYKKKLKLEIYPYSDHFAISTQYKLLGKTKLAQEHLNKTIDYLETLIKIYPEKGQYIEEKAVIFQNIGEYRKAVRIYETLLKKFPAQKAIYLRRYIEALWEINDYSKALKALEEYQSTSSEPDAYIEYEKGVSLKRVQRYDDAIEAFKKSIQISPDEDYGEYGLAQLYRDMGKYEEALKYINIACKKNKSSKDNWLEKGNILLSLKKYDKAIEAYDTNLKEDYKHHATITSKSFTLYLQGKYKEALALLDPALQVKPNHPYHWQNKAECMRKLKKEKDYIFCIKKALVFFEEKLKNAGEDDEILYQIGNIYWSLGEKAKSIQYLRRAIKADPLVINEIKSNLDSDFIGLNLGSLRF